jgi:hypothetical protein
MKLDSCAMTYRRRVPTLPSPPAQWVAGLNNFGPSIFDFMWVTVPSATLYSSSECSGLMVLIQQRQSAPSGTPLCTEFSLGSRLVHEASPTMARYTSKTPRHGTLLTSRGSAVTVHGLAFTAIAFAFSQSA